MRTLDPSCHQSSEEALKCSRTRNSESSKCSSLKVTNQGSQHLEQARKSLWKQENGLLKVLDLY